MKTTGVRPEALAAWTSRFSRSDIDAMRLSDMSASFLGEVGYCPAQDARSDLRVDDVCAQGGQPQGSWTAAATAPLSHSPAKIASVKIPSESLGALAIADKMLTGGSLLALPNDR